ncbi:MAG TPA: FkbM family methyltransferase [Bacteroidales bacterium]|nr:FkbM family methyltransferase [Bacteroidales bacterium]
MNRYLFSIYRVVVPKPVRTIILKKKLREKILAYFNNLPAGEINPEQREILDYLTSNPLAIFPYSFGLNYRPGDVEVMFDEKEKMHYTILDGKKLFFKKRWRAERIKRGYSDLMREQDPGSPHRYLVPGFDVEEDDIIADIGAAEGNFSLSVIDRVRKCYLFEFDREWAAALNTTFSPFGEKAEVINKMVSSTDDNLHIRLDTFLRERTDVTFLKIDVDGAEKEVIGSLMGTLGSKRPLKIAFCTYHRAEDEEEYSKLFRDHGFEVTVSQGYMIPFYDKKIKMPWLRRGLIRAVRK